MLKDKGESWREAQLREVQHHEAIMQTWRRQSSRYMAVILKRREPFLLAALLIMTVFFAMSYLLPKSYTAFCIISAETDGSQPTEPITAHLAATLTEPPLIGEVLDRLSIPGSGKKGRDQLIARIQRQTSVQMLGLRQFTITFADHDPRFARDYLNALALCYLERTLPAQQHAASRADLLLADQLATSRRKLQETNAEIDGYRRESGKLIGIDVGKLGERIHLDQQRLDDLEQRRFQLERGRLVPTARADSGLSGLQAKLNSLKKQLDLLEIQYTGNYPDVVRVKEEIAALQEQMQHRKRDEAQDSAPGAAAKSGAELKSISASEERLRHAIARNQTLLATISQLQAGMQQRELTRQSEKGRYDELLSRSRQLQLQTQARQKGGARIHIVAPARLPVPPMIPYRVKLMLCGIGAGITGAFALVLLLGRIDPTAQEIDVLPEVGVPVLAAIPLLRERALPHRQRGRWILACAALYFLMLLTLPILECAGITVEHLLGSWW